MHVCKDPSEDSLAIRWHECTNSDGPLTENLEKIEIARVTSIYISVNNTTNRQVYTALASGTRVKVFLME